MCLESEKSTGSSKLSRKREKPGDSVSSFTESESEKTVRKTITKTKKGATARNLSSLKVFEEFVIYSARSELGSKKKGSEAHNPGDGEDFSAMCDASGILSKECFDKWVKTRTSKPKYPEESFRRAITAHIRGSDGRRPFKPIIEKALLIELRKKKIWPCFAHLHNKIGVLGYQKLGYHESLSLKNDNGTCNPAKLRKEKSNKSKKQRKELQIQNQQPSSIINVSTNHISQASPLKSIESSHGTAQTLTGVLQQQQQNQSQISLVSTKHHPLHGFMNTIHINQNLMGGPARDGAIRAHATRNTSMPSVISHISQNVGAPALALPESSSAPGTDQKQFLLPLLQSQNSNDVANMFRKYDAEVQLDQFMKTGRNQGANTITSSTNFMLNQQQSLTDPRLQERFLIPDPSTVSFDLHKPKGIVNIDNTTHACLQMDEIAKSLFGGDITGYNAFVLSCSELAMLKQTSIGFRNLQLTGETWMHLHLRRISDSKPVILLTHMVKAGPNETKAVFQDVSERHKFILDLPPTFF